MSELACTDDVGYHACVQRTSGFRRVPKSPALRSLLFRTRVHDGGGDSGMADDPVVAERGVLTAPAEAWDLAVRRAEVIRAARRAARRWAWRLPTRPRPSWACPGGRSTCWSGRWRAGEGLVSDLLPGTSSGGRGGGRLPDEVEAVVREVLRTRYLTRQRRTVASVYREITRECRVRGLRVPSRGTVLRRIAMLDPVKTVIGPGGQGRGAGAAVRRRDAAGGHRAAGAGPGRSHPGRRDRGRRTAPAAGRAPVPYGRGRCGSAGAWSGMVVTLEAPSATSVGLCLAHAAADKRPWLERLEAEAAWPMSGKPRELYVDNAAEFKSEALRRGCEQHGIRLRYRPPGQPHFGGIIERLIGTMMQMVHELPGTTFSSTADRGGYDSGATAVLTLRRAAALARPGGGLLPRRGPRDARPHPGRRLG